MTPDTPANAPEEQPDPSIGDDAFQRALSASLVPLLKDIDLPRLVKRFGSLEAIVDRMMASIPDAVVNDPPVGPCHTRTRLASWQGVSRQSVQTQQRAGRIIGFVYHGRILHPTVQFDGRGRPMPLLRELLNATDGPLGDADRISQWLHEPTGPHGTTRAEQFAEALTASADHPLPDESLTFMRAPSPANDA